MTETKASRSLAVRHCQSLNADPLGGGIVLKRAAIAVSVAGSVLSIASCAQPEMPSRFGVSMAALLANPGRFHDRRVKVIGFVHFEFEGDQICLRKEDSELDIITNCFWLAARDRPPEEQAAANDSYAVVVGTFSSESHGHMGSYSGTIHSVQAMEPWPPSP